MKEKKAKSLEAWELELEVLEREKKYLMEKLEEKESEMRAMQTQMQQTTAALAREATRVSEEIPGLARENNALRQELAQAQSALYTLINKLPRLPEQDY